jgi:MFS family permease
MRMFYQTCPPYKLQGTNAFRLASGCTLLLFGSIADLVGGRLMYLIGCCLLSIASVACGVSRTGIELILFRAFSGTAVAMCLPSSVNLITGNIPTGSQRNVAFAFLGAGQPVGFSIGLVVGGILVQTVSWRIGYYIGAGVIFAVFILSIFMLPADRSFREPVTWTRIKSRIDLVGCALLSTSLGLFCYIFSVITGGASHIRDPSSIALLIIAVALLPAFTFHVCRQERLGRPAIIPPKLWGNRFFTCICIAVFCQWGTFNSFQYMLTLFFQDVQELSPLQTSLRFLPMVVTGVLTNVMTGALAHRTSANKLIIIACAISGISPLLMAIVHPSWSYWVCAFFAVACCPIAADVMFTISNLIITSLFPPEDHGLAGGVFSTMSNMGNSVGLALAAIISDSVTASKKQTENEQERLMDGYRATFWYLFGISVLQVLFMLWGLRKISKVGIKRD